MSPTHCQRDPAEVYDELFVPALFAQWGSRVAAAAAIEPGQHVLDVGCGTGVLACAAAERVGSTGRVVGLDANEQMLAVARRKLCAVQWRHGVAEAMPFADATFDAVVSQFALMFFEPPSKAIAEMLRVLRPHGRLGLAVFDSLERAPGYAALTELLSHLFGVKVADAMRPPFSHGDRHALERLFVDAGARAVKVTTVAGDVRFASIEAMVATERACVWTLGGLLDDEEYRALRTATPQALARFVQSDGTVVFECPAHIVTATKA